MPKAKKQTPQTKTVIPPPPKEHKPSELTLVEQIEQRIEQYTQLGLNVPDEFPPKSILQASAAFDELFEIQKRGKADIKDLLRLEREFDIAAKGIRKHVRATRLEIGYDLNFLQVTDPEIYYHVIAALEADGIKPITWQRWQREAARDAERREK